MRVNKRVLTKILIVLLIVIIQFNFIIPNYSYASGLLAFAAYEVFGGVLFKAIAKLGMDILDSINAQLAWVLAPNGQVNEILGGAKLQWENIKDLFKGDKTIGDAAEDAVEGLYDTKYNLLISPDDLFNGEIEALDPNIFAADSGALITIGNKGFGESLSSGASLAVALKKVISNIYVLLRNIAIVILLCLLIYTGIRILLQTASPYSQAKWKETLLDWVKALVILMFLHYFMIGVFFISDLLLEGLGNAFGDTSIVGMIRYSFLNQKGLGNDPMVFVVYLIMYGYITYLTILFIISYFKRFSWIMICIVISPIVAVTTALGKNVNAFQKWFKEYVFAVLIQPFDLLIFNVLVGIPLGMLGSSVDKWNPLEPWQRTNMIEMTYVLISLSMIKPAEKFLMGLFGFNEASIAKASSSETGSQAIHTLTEGVKKIVNTAINIGAAAVTGGATAAAGAAIKAGTGINANKAMNAFNKGLDNENKSTEDQTDSLEPGDDLTDESLNSLPNTTTEPEKSYDTSLNSLDAYGETDSGLLIPKQYAADNNIPLKDDKDEIKDVLEDNNQETKKALEDSNENKNATAMNVDSINANSINAQAESKALGNGEANAQIENKSLDKGETNSDGTKKLSETTDKQGEAKDKEQPEIEVSAEELVENVTEALEEAADAQKGETSNLADRLLNRIGFSEKDKGQMQGALDYLRAGEGRDNLNEMWNTGRELTNLMYLDGAPSYKNGHEDRKKNIKEHKEKAINLVANDKSNRQYVIEQRNLLDGIENCKTEKEKAEFREKADNKAKEIIKTEAAPFIDKGITDIRVLMPLMDKVKQGASPDQAFRGYAKIEHKSISESRIQSVQQYIADRTGRSASEPAVRKEAEQTMQAAKPYMELGVRGDKALYDRVRLEKDLSGMGVAKSTLSPKAVDAMQKLIAKSIKENVSEIKITNKNSSAGMKQMEKALNEVYKSRREESKFVGRRTISETTSTTTTTTKEERPQTLNSGTTENN